MQVLSWNRISTGRWLAAIGLFVTVAVFGQAAAPSEQGHNVLLLIPGSGGRPTIDAIARTAQAEMLLKGGPGMNVLPANLDFHAEDDPSLRAIQDEWFRARYKGVHFDLIMALGESLLPTAERLRDQMWTGTPIVFCCLDKTFLSAHPSALITGIFAEPAWEQNIELAKRLFPETSHIALTGGATTADHLLNDPVARLVGEQKPTLDFIDLTGLPLPEQITRASRLPQNTVIMGGMTLEDASGRTNFALPGSFRTTLVREANAPAIFIVASGSDSSLPGGLGGYMAEAAELGKEAADLGLSVLSGKTTADAPPSVTHAIHLRLDWREIQRWKIPSSRVPKGAVIQFAPPSLWATHYDALAVAAIAFVAQFILIVFLVAERRRRQASQKQLAERLRFETILAEACSEFAHSANGGMNKAIEKCLHSIHDFFKSSAACTWEPAENGKFFARTHTWPVGDAESRPGTISIEDFTTTLQRLSQGKSVLFSNEMERNLLEDGESFRTAGIRSFLAIPLQDEEHFTGFLALSNLTARTEWPADIVQRMRVIADILGGALSRRHAAEALLESELLKVSILASTQSSIAIIDKQGAVLEVNKHWLDTSATDSAPLQPTVCVGDNYIDICGQASNGGEAKAGIQSVLHGSRKIFEVEYAHASCEEQWFRMTAMQLHRPQGGAVISHLNITLQKLAELEEHRMKEELVLLNRASEMGQLAASLAHELAQPLAAVLSNAQAALRLASRPQIDVAEIRAALADIVEDDQRARAVLNNVRSILKKQAIRPHKVNLNEIVETVTTIVKNNAQARGVTIMPILAPEAVMVNGDDVPLQQVLLNLVNNAMDAMNHVPAEQKVLTLRTAALPQKGSGLLVVEDQGPGVGDEMKDRLFSPFFTTKEDGLGMGLTICRTILQSLGGSIHCQNHSQCGASFVVEIPLAS